MAQLVLLLLLLPWDTYGEHMAAAAAGVPRLVPLSQLCALYVLGCWCCWCSCSKDCCCCCQWVPCCPVAMAGS
jgi:hypothetical protein